MKAVVSLLFTLLLNSAVGQIAPYCLSGPTNYYDTTLGAVNLVGESGTQLDDTTTCPKTIGPKDNTNQIVDLLTGKEYAIRYGVGACGSYYSSLVGAWIDYNQNNQFETTELLFPFVYHANGGQGVQSFVVPAGAKTGKTRLRIQLQETSGTTLDPCFNFTYGATKDFSVNIKLSNPYCTCGPTKNEDTHLGPTIAQGHSSDIVQFKDPCPGSLGPENFTDQLVDMVVGQTYRFAISVVTCNKIYPNLLTTAWADWNQDYVFSADEQLFKATNAFGAIFFDVVVPNNAVHGRTDIRVMTQEVQSGQDSIGACDLFTYGATHDYPAQVLASQIEGMKYRETEELPAEAGMNYREEKPILGAGMHEEYNGEIIGAGMHEGQKLNGMAFREATTGMAYREDPPVLSDESQVNGMAFREGKGMAYREDAPVGMRHREASWAGMKYREQVREN